MAGTLFPRLLLKTPSLPCGASKMADPQRILGGTQATIAKLVSTQAEFPGSSLLLPFGDQGESYYRGKGGLNFGPCPPPHQAAPHPSREPCGSHSPRSSIFTSGPIVNCGRVGTAFSPECDAVGRRGGERVMPGEEGRGLMLQPNDHLPTRPILPLWLPGLESCQTNAPNL